MTLFNVVVITAADSTCVSVQQGIQDPCLIIKKPVINSSKSHITNDSKKYSTNPVLPSLFIATTTVAGKILDSGRNGIRG